MDERNLLIGAYICFGAYLLWKYIKYRVKR